jgi:ADP-ribose pyrophosphatase YjhB (NUDIX family)
MILSFNIRVYALIFSQNNEVLLTDEFRFGMKLTKFPGGGLEFGEGTIECLKREAMEEFGQEIEITQHFYTTDFFQSSMFNSEHQLISIYYIARFADKIKFRISDKPYDFKELTEGSQSFRWYPLNEITLEVVSLPIDKIVVEKLIKSYERRTKI